MKLKENKNKSLSGTNILLAEDRDVRRALRFQRKSKNDEKHNRTLHRFSMIFIFTKRSIQIKKHRRIRSVDGVRIRKSLNICFTGRLKKILNVLVLQEYFTSRAKISDIFSSRASASNPAFEFNLI